MHKKLLSILLTLTMILTLIPSFCVTAYAEPSGTAITQSSFTDGKMTINADGSYYLKENVTGNIEISSNKTVTLDLNGFVLEGYDKTKSVIKATTGSKLTITDSNPNAEHKFIPATGVRKAGLWTWDETKGTEIVKGGIITGGNTSNGGGVYASASGTLVLEGGSIVGCKASTGGGGVYAVCPFTISGGAIIGCENNGVMLMDNANFTMTGGTISNCSSSGDGGGIATSKNITIDMSGNAKITECEARSGGGLCIGNNNNTAAQFTMSGNASISKCSASESKSDSYGGGGVWIRGTMTLKDNASISECEASNGGGVLVRSGTFNMEGGSISQCKIVKNGSNAYKGGGVFVSELSTQFIMRGGVIEKCEASVSGSNNTAGGGVCVKNGGSFIFLGGTITQCNTNNNGGGVYNDGVVTIGGIAKVTGNTKGTGASVQANNLYLVSGKTVTVSTDTLLTQGAAIGVTLGTTDGTGAVTGANSADYHEYFVADNAALVSYNDKTGETNQVVKLKVNHVHSWTYALSKTTTDNDTVSASCTDTCDYAGSDKSLTIQKPTSLTYDGNAKEGIFAQMSFLGKTGTDLPSISYQYKATADGTYAPATDTSQPGFYKANFTVGEGTGVTTAYVEYSVPYPPVLDVDNTKYYFTVTAALIDGATNIQLIGDVADNVTVEAGKTITLDLNGHVLKAAATGNVVANNGTLTIKDSKHSDTTVKHYFTVGSNGVWKWNNDENVTDNVVTGGVITGGYNSYEEATKYGNGVANKGTLIIDGVNIIGNSTGNWGGGLLSEGGSVTVKNSLIAHNYAIWCAAVGIRNNGTYAFESTEISNNKSQYEGGGFYIENAAAILTNCTVLSNTASKGGGLYLKNGASVTMTGGSVANNSAGESNGAAYLTNDNGSACSLTLNGVSVTGNTAKNSAGGIEIKDGHTLTVSGTTKISGNTYGTTPVTSNVHLASGKTITVSGALTFGASIGVTLGTDDGTGAVTNANSVDYHEYFSSDNPNYAVINDGSGANQVVKLSSHLHNWSYAVDSADSSKLTATCSGIGCTATDLTLTITAASVTYDGQPHGATFGAITSFAESSLPAIKYQLKTGNSTYGEAVSTVPTAAGIYKASVTVGADSKATTASIEYEISKAALTISESAIERKSYDGTTNATVTAVTLAGIKGSDTLVLGTDFAVSGVFNSPNAGGTNKATNVAITVTLSGTAIAKNYSISGSKIIGATIEKANQTKTASTPAISGKFNTKIVINAVNVAGESVEYAKSTTNVAPDSDWQDSTEFTGLTANTSYYIFARVKESDNYKAGTASTGLEVKTKGSAPDKPTIAIDFATEKTIQEVPCAIEYKVSGAAIWTTGIGAKVALSPDSTYIFRVKETDTTSAGVEAEVSVPARPATPSVEINYLAETANTLTIQEYSTDGGITWTDCTAGMSVSDWAGNTVQIRVKATDACYKSLAQSITVSSRPAAPQLTGNNENISNKKDAKLSGVTTAMEYKIGSGEWTDGTGADIANANNETIQVRVRATSSSFVGEIQTINFTPSTTMLVVTHGESNQQVAYNGLATKPADPENAGFTFGGWYTDEACTNAWNFSNDKVTASITLYPKWIKNSEDKAVITGTVTDGTNPVEGAIVELKLGTVKVAATVSDSSGRYSFGNVENGNYNIVITKDGKVKTALINIDTEGSYVAPEAVLDTKEVNSKVVFNGTNTTETKSEIIQATIGGVDEIAEAETPGEGEKITITLTVEPKDEDSSNAQQVSIKAKAGNKTIEFLDLTLTKQINTDPATDIGDSNTKLLTINIPFDVDGVDINSIAVYRYHGSDSEAFEKISNESEKADGKFMINGKYITIYAKKFSAYAIGYTKTSTSPSGDSGSVVTKHPTIVSPQSIVNPFVDVLTTDYYYDSVMWAVKNGVTGGIDAKHFAPKNITTRAQMVTFLWRSVGSPVVDYAMPFTDVSEDAYYCEAVRWGASLGYVKGTSSTTFSPDLRITRGQCVTILARLNGMLDEATGYTHPFTDVQLPDYYNNAVAWAATNGITTGITKTLFKPKDSCLRGQIITFIYRSIVK